MFHVVDALATGGAERMAVDISNGLQRNGWGIHVVATRGAGPLANDLAAAIPLHELNRTSRFDLRGMREFRALIRDVRPAIVHAHGWSSLQFASACLVAVRHAPWLVFHDHRPAGLNPVGWSYRASAWPFLRAHLAVDGRLLEQAPPTRHSVVRSVISNGSTLDRFRRKVTYGIQTHPRLVMVANLRPQKAHHHLFASLAILASRGTPVCVDLLGATDDPAYCAACERHIDELHLHECVRIAGSCHDVGDVLANYDLGILTSTSESGPVALIEYLAAGLPFVVTDVGDVTRSLPDQLRRWVVQPGDPEALAERIAEALSRSDDERRSDAEVGLQFARDRLSIDRTVSEVEAVYRHLLSGPNPVG